MLAYWLAVRIFLFLQSTDGDGLLASLLFVLTHILHLSLCDTLSFHEPEFQPAGSLYTPLCRLLPWSLHTSPCFLDYTMAPFPYPEVLYPSPKSLNHNFRLSGAFLGVPVKSHLSRTCAMSIVCVLFSTYIMAWYCHHFPHGYYMKSQWRLQVWSSTL